MIFVNAYIMLSLIFNSSVKNEIESLKSSFLMNFNYSDNCLTKVNNTNKMLAFGFIKLVFFKYLVLIKSRMYLLQCNSLQRTKKYYLEFFLYNVEKTQYKVQDLVLLKYSNIGVHTEILVKDPVKEN